MKDLTSSLNYLGDKLTELLRDRLDSHGLKSSDIYKNMSYTVEEDDGFYELVFSFPNHAIYVDKGRKPGSKMPPQKPIDGWMQKKGISLKASFAIRKMIGVRGIKPRPFLDVIAKELFLINETIADGASESVTIQLDKILNRLK